MEKKVKRLEDHDERMYDTVKRLTERDELQQKSIKRLLEVVNVRQGKHNELQTPLQSQGILTPKSQQTAATKINTGKTFNDERRAKSSNGKG